MKQALIVHGGWAGHDPDGIADLFAGWLREAGFAVTLSDTLDVFADAEALCALDLIVPVWTMGHIDRELAHNVAEAVASGVGLAGCHGGMCDAFREDTEWQFMTGGQWVAHPGGDGIRYAVNVVKETPLTRGVSDFVLSSEQYYMHVDPAVDVLAVTEMAVPGSGKTVEMPVVWTKSWGKGRVYYCSLGHTADVFRRSPEASELMRRGLVWAAGEDF